MGYKNGLFVEQNKEDPNFWQQDLLPKLQKFYYNWLAPEITLNNRKRKIECRAYNFL